MNLNLSPSPFPFPMEQMKEKVEHDDEQQYQAFNFGLNHHQIVSSSSSSSASCHIFFNPTQDHAAFYLHPQYSYQPQPQPHHPQDDYYVYHGGSSSSYETEKKVENGLKLSLQWKKEDEDEVKWMKKEDVGGANKINEVKKVEKILSGDDLSSNSNSNSNNSSYNCNTPIRVCSDCHTTKTPLWRSGPKGPKSLCNACGIRQRKARRAVAAAAAAAAANGGGGMASNLPRATKVKEKMGKIGLKKRCKLTTVGGSSTSTSSGKKKKKKINGFEDFLINLSNKLAYHRVFPQDEKEAAILLMALSSGLVHG